LRLFSFANEEITMLQCYVLTCGRSVSAFSAPPQSQRPGQGPRSPHPKAGPADIVVMCNLQGVCCLTYGTQICYISHRCSLCSESGFEEWLRMPGIRVEPAEFKPVAGSLRDRSWVYSMNGLNQALVKPVIWKYNVKIKVKWVGSNHQLHQWICQLWVSFLSVLHFWWNTVVRSYTVSWFGWNFNSAGTGQSHRT
jgi:hypothetical protein